MSFCIVPTPALETQVVLPGIAYNLHAFEGEGDGGNGFTLLIDHTTTPQSYHVVQVVGKQVQRAVDISAYVDGPFQGNVYPGGTAFCAESKTLWVAIQTQNPAYDTLLTIDVNQNKVLQNISMPKPSLSSHFADCAASPPAVGGFTQATTLGVSSVYVGMLDAVGAFKAFDTMPLPEGSTMQLAAIGDFMHDPRWNPSEYGAILYSSPMKLPGLLFTSTRGKAPATLTPLTVVAASISVEY